MQDFLTDNFILRTGDGLRKVITRVEIDNARNPRDLVDSIVHDWRAAIDRQYGLKWFLSYKVALAAARART
jgi:hypothetical protein